VPASNEPVAGSTSGAGTVITGTRKGSIPTLNCNGTGVFTRVLMAPNDFIGSISLESLGTCVPRENVIAGIQHENRIPDALYEELETLLALPQFFFSFAAVLACHTVYNLACRSSRTPIRA
jgi:hypothetical protein